MERLIDETKNFMEFMESQRKEMETYKWIESEKCGYDLGDKALMDWVQKHAKSYRTWWKSRKK